MKFKMYGLGIVEIFNVLTPEECSELITRTESIGYDEATVNMGNEQHVMKPNLRNNSRVNIIDNALGEKVWAAIKTHIPSKIGDDHALFLDDTFRCYRYYPGEFFGWHVDGATKKDGNRSKYTVLVYLNDDYDGGETEFEHAKVKGTKGSVVVFPHKLLHQGATVISGTKYAIRTDAMYEDHKNRVNETPEERAKRLGITLIPEINPFPKNNDIVGVCGKCGLELRQVMGYCCPNANCPTGMGPVTC